ncbi:MAG TPA: hypothetical protein VGM97_09345 [Steroidobacteraceae bacterium]
MKASMPLVAAIALAGICSPWGANADDIVTLDYQSAPLTGSYTYLPSGMTWNTFDPPLPSAPFTGFISGTVVFDETSLNVGGLIGPIFADFELAGTGTNAVDLYSTAPPLIYNGPCSYSRGADCIGLSSDNGAITGATVGFDGDAYHGTITTLSIQPSGDSASFLLASTQGTCQNLVNETSPGVYTYTGAPISPCSVQASSSMAGTWTVKTTSAPEIDPGAAGSGLTLLAGCLALLRGRRRAA